MRKLAYDQVYKIFKDGGCELLSREYKNAQSKLKYRCKCGNVSDILLHSFKKGQRCQRCADKQLSRRYTIEYIKKFFEDNSCVLLSEAYKDNRANLDYVCSCGEISKITFYNFKQGGRCKKCGGTGKLTFKYVQQYFDHHNCKLLEKEYINAHVKMKYKCCCGDISQINFNHFKQGKRCKKCGIGKISGENNWNYNPNLTDEEREKNRTRLHGVSSINWRKKVYVKDDYTCYICGARGGKLNAHHIESYSTNKKLRFNISNGASLCVKCHKKFHKIYGKKNNSKDQLNKLLKAENSLCLK